MKYRLFQVIITLILLTSSFTGCLEENSSDKSKTIHVDSSGGREFIIIQNAIDNASAGDTVFVHNGTYNESLHINKSINLVGEDRNNTIIEWKNSGSADQNNVIFINADNCMISQLKIYGGGFSLENICINVNSSYNTISDNIIFDSYKGININGDKNNNNIFRNNITNNIYGIEVKDSIRNNISGNNISGSVSDGVFLNVSHYNIVFDNTLSGNKIYGIRIKAASQNKVFENLILKNQIGLFICCGAADNVAYRNTFKQNTKWNARDPMYNQWDNGKYGNFWDDYDGVDADYDGIGDTPYTIIGNITQDRYPLMSPFNT